MNRRDEHTYDVPDEVDKKYRDLYFAHKYRHPEPGTAEFFERTEREEKEARHVELIIKILGGILGAAIIIPIIAWLFS